MKKERLDCEVIQDLLPLYEDNCCSERSKILVEEHLKECKVCQEKRANFQKEFSTLMIEDSVDKKVIKKGIRKIKMIGVIGLSVLLVCFSFVFIVTPIRNYQKGRGITYVNLKELYVARQFMKSVKDKNYEKAYRYLDIKGEYDKVIAREKELDEGKEEEQAQIEGIQQLKEKGFAWYDKVSREEFIKNMKSLEETGFNISNYFYDRISEGVNEWYVYFDIETENGSRLRFSMHVTNDGINYYYKSGLKTEDKKIRAQLKEAKKYLTICYRMPTDLNEEVLEVLYGKDADWWKIYITHNYQK